jgi:Acetyltransferase (GNAT) family.
MRRSLPDGFELDDDRDRVDVDVVHRYLSEEAYWVPGRSRATIEELIRSSTRVIAAYEPEGALVGFCRVVSDGSNMAWLGDVFVLEPYRGRGLGIALVRDASRIRSRPTATGTSTPAMRRPCTAIRFVGADPHRTLVRPPPERS